MQSATRVSGPALAPSWSGGGEGEQLWVLGTLAIIRIPGEAVDGPFSLTEFVFRRHTSPAVHTHPQDESYIVADGLVTVRAGHERFQLSPGGAAAIPAGIPHPSGSTARPHASSYSAHRPASSASSTTPPCRPAHPAFRPQTPPDRRPRQSR